MMCIGPKNNIIEILNANWPEVEVQVQSLQSLQSLQNFLKQIKASTDEHE